MTIEEQMNALFAAPEPACEVITLERSMVGQILDELEAIDPLRSLVVELRQAMAAPRVQLWAMRSVGPNEIYPAMSREHADHMAAELVETGRKFKQRMIEDGESTEYWQEWRAEVIPSPFEPTEHFQVIAINFQDEEERLRTMAIKSGDDRGKLLAALTALLGHLDAAGVPPMLATQKAHETINEVTKEERETARKIQERKDRLKEAVKPQ